MEGGKFTLSFYKKLEQEKWIKSKLLYDNKLNNWMRLAKWSQ